MDSIYRSGAVSIFAVIFSTLLLTVLTVGFISLMISAQQRAINNDLSQSAYDAALAGVEDAKRVVRACATGNERVCQALAAESDCKVIARAQINGNVGDEETLIASSIAGSQSGEEFDQAYTCVNIEMDSPDYLYDAATHASHMVPLRATADIHQIIIDWYTESNTEGQPARAPGGSASQLPPNHGNSWREHAPPLMRTQLINPGTSFTIDSLNSAAASTTLFFRPTSANSGATNHDVDIFEGAFPRAAVDQEQSINSPRGLPCSSNFGNDGYSCRVTLTFDDPISVAASQNAALRLETVYGNASVRVSMRGASGPVLFQGVQPVVDSTGRASDLFRRVEARLRMGADFAYPSYVADIENALCKDFSVTDTGVPNTGVCNP